MKFFIKQAVLPIIYIVLMAFTAIGVMCMNDDAVFLKVGLLILNLALFAYVVGAMAYKDGQDALNIRDANDVERRIIIETGEDRKLKIAEEYAPWKGFGFGLVACSPLIILTILQIIFNLCGVSSQVPEIIATYMFMMISSLIQLAGLKGFAWVVILSLIFVCGCIGIPYIFGAKKIERHKQVIKETHKKIYGKDR